VLQRLQDNAHVPGPHNQVSGLRVSHALKIVTPGVELERTRIWILKTRIEICLMDKVRTILGATRRLVLIPCGINDCTAFFRIQ